MRAIRAACTVLGMMGAIILTQAAYMAANTSVTLFGWCLVALSLGGAMYQD